MATTYGESVLPISLSVFPCVDIATGSNGHRSVNSQRDRNIDLTVRKEVFPPYVIPGHRRTDNVIVRFSNLPIVLWIVPDIYG